jgi:quinol monooxygenase YgiN
MSVLVVVDLPAQPGKAEEIESFINAIVPDTRTFDGFEGITLHRDQEDPNHLLLLERWDSRAHHEKYLAWRTDRGDLATIVGLLAGAPTIRYFNDVEV